MDRSLIERIQFEQQMAVMTSWPVTLFVMRVLDWKWQGTQQKMIDDAWFEAICQRIEQVLPPQAWIMPLDDYDFVIWMPEQRRDRLTVDLAEQMIRLLRVPMEIEGDVRFWDGCIGASALNGRTITVEDWIQESKMALQIAMEQHQEIHIYSHELIESSKRTRLIEQELVGALRRGEFILHYQPKVAPKNRKLIGAETLIRWTHPRLGPISPGEFIPLAEKTGLIHAVGEWVLEETCKQLKLWNRRGLPTIPISVNVSACQLQRSGFAEQVKEIIERTGVDPKWIELEITETESIHQLPLVLDTMNKIRSYGVHLSIDDFGTGYSSYEYLYHFPVNTLKMDLRFLMNDTKIVQREIIVRSMIDLAKSLNLTVIAEGVETQEWFDLLHRLGCDGIQGYFISRPEPAKKLEQMLIDEIRQFPMSLAAIG